MIGGQPEGSKENCVSAQPKSANGNSVQIALRETKGLLVDYRFWVSLAAVTAILAISAPFSTGDTLSFGELVAYWGLISCATFIPAVVVSKAIGLSLSARGWPEWTGWATGGIAAGLPVTTIVLVVNSMVFTDSITSNQPLWLFALQCTTISLAIVAVFYIVEGPNEPPEPVKTASPETLCPLISRLSPETGSDIISLQAQDHYVDVVTTRAHEMLLMRLADAESEMGAVDGARLHRSWWVAAGHARRIERDGDRVSLVLSDDRRVPVARGKLTIAKQLVDNAAS